MRGDYVKCEHGRVFGHGATLGSLQGAQAEQVLVPNANLVLRPVPDGMEDGAALFAGDVMATGFHAIDAAGMQPGDTVAVLGLGPGRPVRGAGREGGRRRGGDRGRPGSGAAGDGARRSARRPST